MDMPNYRETTGMGTSWTRSYRVTCNNAEDRRSVWFDEERVMVGPDGTRMSATSMGMGCGKDLTAENSATVFPRLDADGTPTGESLTYQDVYLILMSLYYHVATERDAAAQPT